MRWILPALSLSLLLAPSAPSDASQDIAAEMNALASAYRGAEETLATGALPSAEALAALLQGFGRLSEHAGMADHRAALRQLRGMNERLQERHQAADLRAVREGLAEIGRACAACHASVRPQDEHPPFPSRGALLRGRVKLKDARGTLREDAAGIVVFLDGVAYTPSAPPLTRPVVSQSSRQFSPRILPIQVGTTVEFPNDDTIYHNAFSKSKTKPFDLDAYGPKVTKTVTFDQPGLVPIYCHLHPEMTCSILVLNNPWFAVTDARGEYRIADVPPGTYSLRTWNELGVQTRQELIVSQAEVIVLDLTAEEKLERKKPHTDKFGKPYRERY